MMTPERRAEIEAAYDGSVKGAVRELLAEIDRLNKVVDQAIGLLDIEIIEDGHSRIIECTNNAPTTEVAPELAAELERRSKA